MTETEEHDLLITLNLNMKDICGRMKAIEGELKKRQCLLHTTQIKHLEDAFDPKICVRNTLKLHIIEKVSWAGFILVSGLVIKSLWDAITK